MHYKKFTALSLGATDIQCRNEAAGLYFRSTGWTKKGDRFD